MKKLKNKIEHNEGILREIRNRIMKEIWSIIPTSLHLTYIGTSVLPDMYTFQGVQGRGMKHQLKPKTVTSLYTGTC